MSLLEQLIAEASHQAGKDCPHLSSAPNDAFCQFLLSIDSKLVVLFQNLMETDCYQ